MQDNYPFIKMHYRGVAFLDVLVDFLSGNLETGNCIDLKWENGIFGVMEKIPKDVKTEYRGWSIQAKCRLILDSLIEKYKLDGEDAPEAITYFSVSNYIAQIENRGKWPFPDFFKTWNSTLEKFKEKHNL
ncbi:MAG: hypothetical protein ABH817_00830 [archaeon]